MFPEADPSGGVSNEFIGIFTAPATTGWIGNSLGGGMTQGPLILAWINDFQAMISVRRAIQYGPPSVMSGGPTVTVLGGSGVTSDGLEQRIIFRCQNCTTWEGGSESINLDGWGPLGFATHGAIKPLQPSTTDSPVYQHTYAGIHVLDAPAAKTAQYWDNLKKLQDLPQLPPPATPTTTPVPEPTNTLPACPGVAAPVYGLNVADGWKATPVLGRLQRPRSIITDNQGHLLVLEAGVGVTAHTLGDDGCVTRSVVLIDDTTLNHGLDLTPKGDKLIASSPDIAWSWEYNATALTAYNRKTLVYGMNNPGHVSRTVWVSRKYPDYLLVSVGSGANIDLPSFERGSGRAQIRVFDMRALPPSGIPYTSGAVMGYGIRNDVGITEDRNGTIHSVENSVDNAYREVEGSQIDIHNNNPAEKVYRLGDPRNPTGLFGGYPYCYTVWEGEAFTDASKVPGDWFVQAPNATLNDEWCNENAIKPTVLLPPHTAPLDMKFGPRQRDSDLYVTLHGSWNRNPPQGYKVVVVPGKYSSSGDWSPSVGLSATKTSFTDLLSNRNETDCQNGCFRPVGLTFTHNGDWLYISSDGSGEVFLLKRAADPTQTTTTTTGTTTTTTTSGPTPTTPSGPQQTPWGQCGGQGYTGPTACPAGFTCKYNNLFFSQCVSGEWKGKKGKVVKGEH